MKFVAFNGYFKFYFDYAREDRDVSPSIFRDNLVKVQDYYTFSKAAKLRTKYYKGQLILGAIESPCTVETSINNLENIFLLTGLYYDYTTGNVFKGAGKDNLVTFQEMNSLPTCGLNNPIIRGKIVDNRIIIQ